MSEQLTLRAKWRKVIAEVPNFVTDEKAEIASSKGNRVYKYLGLSTMLKSLKPVFDRHGVMFSQQVNFSYNAADGKGMQIATVDTVIMDDNDELTVGRYPVVIVGDPQANGSAITYARRYALYAALGIFPEKDDDGAKARDYTPGAVKTRVSQEQWSRYQAAVLSIHEDIKTYAESIIHRPLARPGDLSVDEYNQIMDSMGAKK